MSSPIIIIFERHWDTIPKQLTKELLPDLSELGYDTLCVEASPERGSNELISSLNDYINDCSDTSKQAEVLLKNKGITQKLSEISFNKLAQLLQLFVSSQRYTEVAEMIKNLEASQILQSAFKEASRFSMKIVGIDTNAQDLNQITSTANFSERIKLIDYHETSRINTFANNLLKLRNEGRSIVFICGARHAENIVSKLEEMKMKNDLLYYFPHSSKRISENYDDVKLFLNKTLENHTYLLDEKEIKSCKNRVITEVKSKTKYSKELPNGTSTSKVLGAIFNAPFKVFERPNHFVDALVDYKTPDIETIEQRLAEKGVPTHMTQLDNHPYLAVFDINTQSIATKIHSLKQ